MIPKLRIALGLAALASAIALQGCSGTPAAIQTADASIAAPQTQADIGLACDAVQVADAGFQIAVKAGYVDAASATTEVQIMVGVAKACAQPYPQNTIDVVKTVFGAAAQVAGLTATAHAIAAQ